MIVTAAISVIFSCARQAAPSGGPRDVTPPKVIRSIPPNGAVDFAGTSIVITFDEYLAPLDKLYEKFMISPPLLKKPDIELRGKNLYIKFNEELRDSSTYTLYFGDLIKDLNEGNLMPNFQFVFSTGDVLDSLSVTGNIYKASNLEIPESTLILMYKEMADSAPVKLIPDYITLADINGGFRINNVKEGTYNLYGLQEKNNNKKYDLPEEGFAFMNKPAEINRTKNYLPVIVVKDTAKVNPAKVKTSKGNPEKANIVFKKPSEIPLIDGEYKLFLFTALKKNHYLSSSGRKTTKLLNYTLSLPPDSIGFEFKIQDADKRSYFLEKNSSGDTIDVWLTDSLLYSKQQIKTIIDYPFTDSTGVTKLKTDTIPLRFTETKAMRTKEAMTKYTFTTNLLNGILKPNQQIVFLSQTPFRPPDTTKIRLYETHKKSKIRIPYSFIKDSLNSKRYYLNSKFREDSTYLFIADFASFGNIYGKVADSVGMKFSIRSPESYGQLTMNITNVHEAVIIQLLDHQEKVLSERKIKGDSKIEFLLLEPGKYRVRAIYDLNGDGKWTTGDYKLNRQPEPVSYFQDEIEIKSNWENVLPWDIGKKNQKDQKLRAKRE
jgi:uncharacterized protein (DUF2141 family)